MLEKHSIQTGWDYQHVPPPFSGIVSFFAIIHIPLKEQQPIFENIFRWLKPGGYLMVTVGHKAWTGYEEDWYGARMYWSHADEDIYVNWLQEIGFVIQQRQFIPEGDSGHVLLLAQRPSDRNAHSGNGESAR